MQAFLQCFAALVLGVLSGFDRLRFRGTLRLLANSLGMLRFLGRNKVLLKDCSDYMQDVSRQLRERTEALAQRLDRPLVYLPSSVSSKEQLARDIAGRDGIQRGLIAVQPDHRIRVLNRKELTRYCR